MFYGYNMKTVKLTGADFAKGYLFEWDVPHRIR